MSLLGQLYRRTARYEEAEALFSEAVALRQRVLGLDHPDTMDSMNGLANTYYYQARYAEATDVHGPSHPELGAFRYNLATLAAARGERKKALELLQMAHRDGWIDPWILDDPTLSALRGLPVFEALAARSRESSASG